MENFYLCCSSKPRLEEHPTIRLLKIFTLLIKLTNRRLFDLKKYLYDLFLSLLPISLCFFRCVASFARKAILMLSKAIVMMKNLHFYLMFVQLYSHRGLPLTAITLFFVSDHTRTRDGASEVTCSG